MKQPKQRLAYTLFVLAALIASPAFLSSAGIEVPDLETKIRNSGGEVPAAALPVLPNPAPAPIPVNESAAETAPLAPAIVSEPEAELPLPAVPAPEEPRKEGFVSGGASLGAGSPGTLSGDLAVYRVGGTLPDFAFRFSYDGADGFGGEDTGKGFFDRFIALGARAASSAWNVSLNLSERTDGLQGMNADLYSLTARDALWDASVILPLSAKHGLSATVGMEGAVFTAFADRPGTALSSGTSTPVSVGEPIADSGGYRIEPSLALTLARGRGTFAFKGAYGYETAVNTGEKNTGNLALTAEGRFGRLTLGTLASVALDSDSGASFPFNLTAAWKDDSGAVRLLSASGGMEGYRSGVESLAEVDPFVSRNRLSRTAADWFGRLEARLLGPALLGAETGLDARTTWRSTALGFGILDTRPIASPSPGDSAGLVGVGERERQSLETELGLTASSDTARFGTRWSSEWLDSDARKSPQRLAAELALFDRDSRRRWETGASVGFDLTGGEMAELSLSGTLRPAQAFALTLSFDDIVPLASGEPRMRDSVYADRSGVLMLSGRIDF